MVAIKNSKSGGFSLVELLVAVSIFTLVVAAVSEIFVQSLRSQRRFLAEQEILDQTSYIMEYLSRSIRMARKDIEGTCIGAKLNYQKTYAGQGIKFQNYQGDCQEFYLEAGRLKENKAGVIFPLTSANLRVANFNIGSDDSWDQDDSDQPKITFFLEIQGKEQSKIRIQTTISQRNLDIEQ